MSTDTSSADGFDLPSVESAITGTRFSGLLNHLASVGSTNELALTAAQSGCQSGTVFVADEQTAGKGRGGHGWHSAVGLGLYVSVLLRPAMPLSHVLWLTLATGLAARSAIDQLTGLDIDIRWPNDLLLGDRKCGGILVEASSQAGPAHTAAVKHAVIGIGINVNHSTFAPGLESVATSLALATGKPWRRDALLSQLLLALDHELNLLEQESAGARPQGDLLERFARASSWVSGKCVRVDEGGGYTGVTDGLDSAGFLRVAGDDGRLHTVLSGGVRPYSSEIPHGSSHATGH